MGLKANMSRIVDRNVEEIDLPISRGILANMSTNFFDVTSTRNSSANDDLRFVYLILTKIWPPKDCEYREFFIFP